MKLFDLLTEGVDINQLKKNKVALSDDERKLVLDKKAVWHHGKGGAASPAVWKSVCPKTKKATFVTQTHRMFATASTCNGAIAKYHDIVKDTA